MLKRYDVVERVDGRDGEEIVLTPCDATNAQDDIPAEPVYLAREVDEALGDVQVVLATSSESFEWRVEAAWQLVLSLVRP